MKWFLHTPQDEGWYFIQDLMKEDPDKFTRVVKVYRKSEYGNCPSLLVTSEGERPVESMYYSNYRWAGPIELPEV